MPRNTESLIDELVASAPARQRRRLSAAVVSIGFFFLFTVAVTSVMYVVSPFRSSLGHELLGLPRFAIEMIAGLAFVAYAVYLSIQLSIPGLSAVQRRRYAYLLFALLLSWLLLMASVYVVELMPVTMSGKRHLCFVETVIYAWPGSLILLVLVRRRFPIYGVPQFLTIALASSVLPAVLMQAACVYEVHHGMTHHVLPAVLNAGVLTLVLMLLWRFWFANKTASNH